MAERRMFAKSIIDSDMFIDMPTSSRLLYYDLSMRADDDGFVNSPKKIIRMTGASDDDLRILITKKFIIPFESGVVVIKHWKIHNYIQNDRYKPTIYTKEKSSLVEDKSKEYYLDTECIQPVSISETQVRLGKDRIEQDSLVQESKELNNISSPKKRTPRKSYSEKFEKFWAAYPKKKAKGDAEKAFNKLKPDNELLETILKALEWQRTSKDWTKENGQYIPNPATYLNGRRWEDEPEKGAVSNGESSGTYEDDSGVYWHGIKLDVTRLG